MRWGAFVVAAFFAAQAADAASPEVDRHIATAIKLRQKKAYAKAMAELAKAQKKSRGTSDNVTIALDEGVILIDMGHFKKAKAKFKQALSADPDAQLALEVSPKVAQAFENMRAQTKAVSVPFGALAAEKEKTEPAKEEPAKEPEPRVELIPAKPAPEPDPAPAPAPTPPPATRVTQAEPVAAEPVTVRREAPAPERHHRTWALVPTVGGAAAAGVGAYFAIQAKSADDVLAGRSGPPSLGPAQALQYRNTGLTDRGLAIGLIGAGSVIAVAGAVLYLMPTSDSRVALGPSGAVLMGRF